MSQIIVYVLTISLNVHTTLEIHSYSSLQLCEANKKVALMKYREKHRAEYLSAECRRSFVSVD